MGKSRRKCAHPECTYVVNSDPSISTNYCCEKCEGVHQGADWAEGGKRHYKSCEKIEVGSPEAAGYGGGGWGCAGGMCKGGKKGWESAYDPYAMWAMWAGKGAKGGKAWGKGFESWGKGGGGGKARTDSGLKNHPAENKVWVGDLPEGITAEDLTAHFGLAGTVKLAALMKTGTAGLAFSDATEAQAAVLHLNGTEIGGKTIQVDVWTGK
ncbi:unnamed protein product [Prorocentrum cordatum]|nr:unnamed protein product [Polarella glacialis]